MNHRILDVTAPTTLDTVRGSAHGLDWVEQSTAVVDVTATDGEPPAVALELELDPTDLGTVGPHADTVRLSPAQARTLATALRDAAAEADLVGPPEE